MQGVKCDTLQEDSMRCATSACVQEYRDKRIMLVPVVTYHGSCRYCFKEELPHMYPRKIHLLSPWGASLPVSSPLRRFKRLHAFVSTLWPVNANTAPLIKVASSFGHLFDNIEVAENIHFLLHIKIHVILPFSFSLSLCVLWAWRTEAWVVTVWWTVVEQTINKLLNHDLDMHDSSTQMLAYARQRYVQDILDQHLRSQVNKHDLINFSAK